jgi:DNA-binding MarR family transcriptional regulator
MNDNTFPDRNRTLGALLRAPWEVLSERVYDELARSGFPEIRPAHGAVFRFIAPEGSRVVELAEAAGMAKQSMTYLVRTLEQHGYVAIRPDPEDGRARLVRLTRRGEQVQHSALRLTRRIEKEWAKLIGEEEMARLRELLESLYDALRRQP